MPNPKSLTVLSVVSLLVAGLGCGCAPPTEAMRLVSADRAPLLPEPEADEAPFAWPERGTALRVDKPVMPLNWKGRFGDQEVTRSGQVLGLGRAGGEHVFGFASDLGPEVQVVTAEWLCRKMATQPGCPERLRRIQLDDVERGTLLAYDPFATGAGRIALLRGRALDVITVYGLADVRLATVDGVRVVLANARWVKEPTWTGAATEIIELAPKLTRGLVVTTEEIDARKPPSVVRMGALKEQGGALVFEGTRRIVSQAYGEMIREEKVREIYHLRAPTPVAAPTK